MSGLRFHEPLPPKTRRRRIGTRQSPAGSMAAYLARKRERREELKEAKAAEGRPRLVWPLTEYADKPVEFIHEVFGVVVEEDEVRPWISFYEKQQEIVGAILTEDEISVLSGNGVGKSFMPPFVAWWWVWTRRSALVVVTSTVERQVTETFWEKFREAWLKCRYQLGPEPSGDVQTGWTSENRENRVFGYVAKKREHVQGTRRKHMLVVVDEASGVPDEVNDGIRTLLTGGGKRMNFGNPTRSTGWYHDQFVKRPASVKLFEISCFDTPNVQAGRVIVPGLVTIEWVQKQLETYGEDDPRYIQTVLGRYVSTAESRIFPDRLLDECCVAIVPRDANAPRRFGLDIAGEGDDADESVLTEVQGNGLVGIWRWGGMPLPALAVAVSQIIGDDSLAELRYDATGIGRDFGTFLTQAKFRVWGVHFGQKAREQRHFSKARCEMPWDAQKWMKRGGRIPNDEKLRQELEKITFLFDNRFRIESIGKKALRALLGRSPDTYDAFCLALYGTVSEQEAKPPPPRPLTPSGAPVNKFRSGFKY